MLIENNAKISKSPPSLNAAVWVTMKKIWCETDLVLDKFEIGSGKRQKSSYWSKLELRW